MPSHWMEEKKPWQEQGSQERSVQVGEHGFTSEKLLLGSLDGGSGGIASGGHGSKGSMGVGKPPFLPTSPTACTARGPAWAALAAALMEHCSLSHHLSPHRLLAVLWPSALSLDPPLDLPSSSECS